VAGGEQTTRRRENDVTSTSTTTLTPSELEGVRRTRRRPRRTQFDYLHLRRLIGDLTRTLRAFDTPAPEVLDVYCGSRPYDDLLPAGSRCTGLDVPGNPYGVADVVSDDFLPFPDASFDLVTCYEAFHYVEDPAHGVAELYRVLRPGGMVLIAVPFVWEYDRTILEHRYTGPELAALLGGWDDVRVIENGGRAVAWATLTGSILERARLRLPRPARVLFAPAYVLLNGCGGLLDALERRGADGTITLPMNLLATARKPEGA
jgi:SAM-dependent methyltransferase